LPAGSTLRTHATTVFLSTSDPAQQACHTSIRIRRGDRLL
jgi:hypothetical protein